MIQSVSEGISYTNDSLHIRFGPASLTDFDTLEPGVWRQSAPVSVTAGLGVHCAMMH